MPALQAQIEPVLEIPDVSLLRGCVAGNYLTSCGQLCCINILLALPVFA